MAGYSIKGLISQRGSVRTYDGTPLRTEDRQKLEIYARSQKLSSPVVLGDIQKVDVGIALAHFALTMEESGADTAFFADDPGMSRDMEHIISCRV